jgi:hypothetical protein
VLAQELVALLTCCTMLRMLLSLQVFKGLITFADEVQQRLMSVDDSLRRIFRGTIFLTNYYYNCRASLCHCARAVYHATVSVFTWHCSASVAATALVISSENSSEVKQGYSRSLTALPYYLKVRLMYTAAPRVTALCCDTSIH